MDSATALVQAYLYTNGYFTVTEYPVIEDAGHGDYRARTDLDILAVRLPGARRLVPMRSRNRAGSRPLYEPDTEMDTTDERVDMIIGEVKQGRAELNRGARDRAVLETVLARFGATRPENARRIGEELMREGTSISPSGPRVRLIAFGSWAGPSPERHYQVITHAHILEFLSHLAEEHWDILEHSEFKDAALGVLAVIEKAKRARERMEGMEG